MLAPLPALVLAFLSTASAGRPWCDPAALDGVDPLPASVVERWVTRCARQEREPGDAVSPMVSALSALRDRAELATVDVVRAGLVARLDAGLPAARARQAHVALSVDDERLGDLDGAQRHAEAAAALALDPAVAPVDRADTLIRLCQAQAAAGRSDDALDTAEGLIAARTAWADAAPEAVLAALSQAATLRARAHQFRAASARVAEATALAARLGSPEAAALAESAARSVDTRITFERQYVARRLEVGALVVAKRRAKFGPSRIYPPGPPPPAAGPVPEDLGRTTADAVEAAMRADLDGDVAERAGDFPDAAELLRVRETRAALIEAWWATPSAPLSGDAAVAALVHLADPSLEAKRVFGVRAVKASLPGWTADAFWSKVMLDLNERRRVRFAAAAPNVQRAFRGESAPFGLLETLFELGRHDEVDGILRLHRREVLGTVHRGAAGVPYTPREAAWLAALEQLGADAAPHVARLLRTTVADRAGIPLPPEERATEATNARVEASARALRALLERIALEGAAADRAPDATLDTWRPAAGDLPPLPAPGRVVVQLAVVDFGVVALVSAHDGRRGALIHVLRGDLDDAVGRFLGALGLPDTDPVPAARALHDLVFAPLEPLLGGATEVTVLADGSLRGVPFAALHDGSDWLVRRYTFLRGADRPAPTDGPLALDRVVFLGSPGAATVGGAAFGALPGVRAEGEALAGVVPGASVVVGPAFDRDRVASVLRERPAAVQLATHFYLAAEDERASFLLLGDGGALSLRDLRVEPQWSFDGVGLVVLSACNTGVRGLDLEGTEFEGVGEVLLGRGAGAVVATHWPIADVSPATWTAGFYSALASGADLPAAVRAGQLAVLDAGHAGTAPPEVVARAARAGLLSGRGIQAVATAPADWTPPPDRPWAHPYHWAPFVLTRGW